MEAVAQFHGFTAVAPLKPIGGHPHDADIPQFHGFTAVAPLKLGVLPAPCNAAPNSTASPPWPH